MTYRHSLTAADCRSACAAAKKAATVPRRTHPQGFVSHPFEQIGERVFSLSHLPVIGCRSNRPRVRSCSSRISERRRSSPISAFSSMRPRTHHSFSPAAQRLRRVRKPSGCAIDAPLLVPCLHGTMYEDEERVVNSSPTACPARPPRASGALGPRIALAQATAPLLANTRCAAVRHSRPALVSPRSFALVRRRELFRSPREDQWTGLTPELSRLVQSAMAC